MDRDDWSKARIEIKPFQPRNFGEEDAPVEYTNVKKRFGSLAATDQDSNSHFELHGAAKRLLGVEKEELSHIEDRVQSEVKIRLEQLTEQAYQEGFKRGTQDGQAEAEKKAQHEFIPRLEQLDSFLKSMDSIKEDIYFSNERVLIQLIFDIAKEILLRDLKSDREYVKQLAAKVIQKIGAKDAVRVRVSREDYQNAESIREFIKSTFPELKNIQIDPSDDLALGGCKVETDLSRINAAVATQLAALESNLSEV